ncbi:hypothetical protein BC332_27690 [Capsicum chinense]|nr:hypothetical protein BC332_27690 [Capsicum chinense]
MSEGDSFYVENVNGDDHQFTVFDSGRTDKVDLLEKSCRMFELVKIPCAHAMASLQSKHNDDYGLSIYEYSSPMYKVEEYLLAYSKSINVVSLESEWSMPQEFLDVNNILPLVDTKLRRRKGNALRAWARLSRRRGGTSGHCARDPGTREPLVITKNHR